MTRAWRRGEGRRAARALGVAGAWLMSAAGCGAEPPGDDAGETDGTGADLSELAPFEAGPLCGEAGARRILELPADAIVRAGGDGVVEVDERLYVAVEAGYEATTAHSVGPCGEAPAAVGELSGGGVFSLPPWPAVPVGCAANQIAVLDPTGQVGPQPVLGGCRVLFSSARPVSAGVVRQRAQDDAASAWRLSFNAYASGATPAFEAELEITSAAGLIEVLDDEVLFTAPAGVGALTRASLPSLEAEVLAADVINFAATAEHLLYFVEMEPNVVAAVLRARESGDEVVLEFSAPAWVQPGLGYDTYSIELGARAAVLPRPYPDVGAWIVDLESGAEHLIEGDYELVRQVADGRWFARDGAGEGLLLDLENDAEALVADDYGAWPSWVGDDALLQLKDAPQGLWRTAYDGSPPQLLATRASAQFVLLSDGRVLTKIEVDDDGLGALVVVDSSTLEERLIDPAVGGFAWGLGGAEPVEPGVVAYQVVDGERSGVYRINLGP